MKEKRGHKSSEHLIPQPGGSSFIIKIRISIENSLVFSAILGYYPPKSTKLFLLRRYNGKSHEHKNKLESENVFYDFHIHTATERYQQEEISRKAVARFSDVCEKQFSSLTANKERIEKYFKENILSD